MISTSKAATKILRPTALIVRTSYAVDRFRFLAFVAIVSARQLLPFVTALGLRSLSVAAFTNSGPAPAFAAGLVGASIGITFGLGRAQSRVAVPLLEHTIEAYERQLLRIVNSLPYLDDVSRPEFLDRIEKLRFQPQLLGQNGSQVVVLVWGTLQLILLMVAAVAVGPLLLLLPLAALPTAIASRFVQKAQQRALYDGAEARRLSTEYFLRATRSDSAAEVFVLNAGELLVARHHQNWRDADERAKSQEMRGAVTRQAFQVASGFGYIVLLGVAIHQWNVGLLRLGDFLIVVVLGGIMNQQLVTLLDAASRYWSALDVANDLLWLEDYGGTLDRASPAVSTTDLLGCDSPAPETPISLRLRNVTYRYADASQPAVDDVSLDVRSATAVAIVGLNGSGKSTLLHLILGLRRPSSGQLIARAMPINSRTVHEWRSSVSAAFQDHLRPEFRLHTAVGLGDLSTPRSVTAIEEALREAAAPALLSSAPNGLETQLGSSWDGGWEPSAGQWQAIARARGLLRRHATILGFDEPTSDADPIVEHLAISEWLSHRAKWRIADGTTFIFVTHRVSATANADAVVVMDAGRVVEFGTPRKLLENDDTLYSRLYRADRDQNAARGAAGSTTVRRREGDRL